MSARVTVDRADLEAVLDVAADALGGHGSGVQEALWSLGHALAQEPEATGEREGVWLTAELVQEARSIVVAHVAQPWVPPDSGAHGLLDALRADR